ncbi:hypothetical protein OBBRIDRAFT_740404 [Obba rivulosa]|uniref:Uncharacterized protein n=1 Tax=Obba rivulosa TaxID=1052685 RepID=A0A8E2DGS6_9APHY|nr:hypothetical protein OBBRIDRAFT_740404 [Obba rivulosa]
MLSPPVPVWPVHQGSKSGASEYGDIRVEYHPSSGQPHHISRLDQFTRGQSSPPLPPPLEAPYAPFASREDFDFAHLVLTASMNKSEINAMIKLIHRIMEMKSFTFQNEAEIEEQWSRAAKIRTPWIRDPVSVQLGAQQFTFDLWYKDLWKWAEDLMQDSFLAPHFTWNAERLSKFDGAEFVRFIDEPWTADRWWTIQDTLDINAKPFCIILYADKTKLSSFGTHKGYPVIARCANLPIHIRNSNIGPGGGRVVGWLPIVPDDCVPNATQQAYLKRAVWHQAFQKILAPIADISHHGQRAIWAKPYAPQSLRVCPIILILSADYEEQCVMALTRGTNGHQPCPICQIPKEDILKYDQTYDLRTTSSMQLVLKRIDTMPLAKDKEQCLSTNGLYNIQNAFWKINLSDPYQALSFDRLHTFNLGLWGRHLWHELKDILQKMGPKICAIVNKQCDQLPPWRNLTHNKSITNIDFNDGSKSEDISKIILFVTQNVITPQSSPQGYKLLRCIRAFINVDRYAAFEVHTTHTLDALKHAINILASSIMAGTKVKGWNFPKNHLYQHLIKDIREKGVTRNTNTKPNEQLHGKIKAAYHTTNYKNIAEQMLKRDHFFLICDTLHMEIEHYDSFHTLDVIAKNNNQPVTQFGHIYIGAYETTMSLQAAKAQFANNAYFENFDIKLAIYLNAYTASCQKPSFQLIDDTLITNYHFIKADYASMVDWRIAQDYLRCNPSWHGNPAGRYDHIIFRISPDDESAVSFGQLIFIFTIKVHSDVLPLALVCPFDPVLRRSKSDLELELLRVRQSSLFCSEIIPLASIVRGALLVPAYDDHGLDRLVVDTIDSDMFLRVKPLLRS